MAHLGFCAAIVLCLVSIQPSCADEEKSVPAEASTDEKEFPLEIIRQGEPEDLEIIRGEYDDKKRKRFDPFTKRFDPFDKRSTIDTQLGNDLILNRLIPLGSGYIANKRFDPFMKRFDPFMKRFDPFMKRFDPYLKRFDPHFEKRDDRTNRIRHILLSLGQSKRNIVDPRAFNIGFGK